MSLEQVQELMERAYSLPYGEARSIVTEEALRAAEAAGDPSLTFQVRMELGSAYQFGGEPIKTFTTFSRCLAEFDADPSALDPMAEHRLLWQFKWIVYSLTQFPEVPLDRTRAVLEDMERRYKQGGHSLQAVYARRARVAQHLGTEGPADRWFALWHTTPRDELSDCEGCDPSGKASLLAWRGRDDEALAVAEPVLRAELNCAEQPQSILTTLLPIFLRSGRLDDARAAHLRGYRVMRSRLNDMSHIGDHVEFCARSGNEARGLEIVQRHLGWLGKAPSPHAEMSFAAAAALLLRRVEEAGHGELKLSRPSAEEGAPPTEVAVGDLRAELTERARDLAAKFDARNGNEHQSGLITSILDAEPIVEHLPLTEYDRAPTTVTVPAGSAGAEGAAGEATPSYDDITDLDTLLDLAEEEWQASRVERAIPAWHRFDELAASVTLTPRQQARRGDGTGVERFARNDIEGAQTAWRQAADRYEQAGDLVSRHAALGRVGALLCGQGRLEEGLALLNASVAHLDEHAPGSRRAFAAHMRLAGALLNADRPAEAVPVLEGLESDDREDSGELQLMRARTLLATGSEPDAVAPFLYGAREALRDGPSPDQFADASLLLAKVLVHRAQHVPEDGEKIIDEALSIFDEAVAAARGAGNVWLATVVHAERGNLLLSLDRPADAIPDSTEAVAGFTAIGAVPQATFARVDLASSYYAVGRHLEAAETAEEALPVLLQLEDADTLRRCRLVLAHAQRDLGEEQAADLFTELSTEEPDPGASARFLEMAAEVLTALDKDALAAERFIEAAEGFATAGDQHGVVRARRQAGLCRLWTRQLDEGLTEMARARAALADLPADNPPAITWQTALVDYDEARILAESGRLDDALARVTSAIEGFTELDEEEATATATRLRDDIKAALENQPEP